MLTELEFHEKLIKNYKEIESWYGEELKDYMKKEGVDIPFYEYYKPIIDLSSYQITAFMKETPITIKLLLKAGLELAKCRLAVEELSR